MLQRALWQILSGGFSVGVEWTSKRKIHCYLLTWSFSQGNSTVWFISLCLCVVIYMINAYKLNLLKVTSIVVNWWIRIIVFTFSCFCSSLYCITSSTLSQSNDSTYCFNKNCDDNKIKVILKLIRSVIHDTSLHFIAY
jgi:hypothetical protein